MSHKVKKANDDITSFFGVRGNRRSQNDEHPLVSNFSCRG